MNRLRDFSRVSFASWHNLLSIFLRSSPNLIGWTDSYFDLLQRLDTGRGKQGNSLLSLRHSIQRLTIPSSPAGILRPVCIVQVGVSEYNGPRESMHTTRERETAGERVSYLSVQPSRSVLVPDSIGEIPLNSSQFLVPIRSEVTL